MFSRFTKLFKKNDIDEQKAFQVKVARILIDLYPDKVFELTDDPLTLECGGTVLGLTNLKSNFLLRHQTDAGLRELISDHYRKAFAGTGLPENNDLSWEQAKPKLMPQLMPISFLEKMDLVHFPFGEEIVLGIVIDADETYGYILNSNLADWGIGEGELRRSALENLSLRSRGIEMTEFTGDNGIFVIQTMDGFDAARIVEPEMRSFIAEHVGSPFYFGVPNRDFLICWSKNDDESFQHQMRTQISSDCDEQPYPLSRYAFEVTSENEVRQTRKEKIDPRGVTAKSN